MIDPNNNPEKLANIGVQICRNLNNSPYVAQIDNEHIQLYAWQNFLSQGECTKLITLIDKDAQPSTLYVGTEQEGFRTSSSCNMDAYDPFIQMIDTRISDAIGFNKDFSETIQGQRYQIGQQFKAHHDYFHTCQDYWQHEAPRGGQRCWTTMVFLNNVISGGDTEFPSADVGIEPSQGMLLIWNNMNIDGTPNPYTLHTGTPVVMGTKYIITKWFRQNKWG